MNVLLKPTVSFGIFAAVLFAFFTATSLSFHPAGRAFPLVIGIPAFILCLIQVYLDIREARAGGESRGAVPGSDFIDIAADTADIPPEIARKRALRFLGWYLLFYLGIWVVGFKVAGPLFLLAFLRIEARSGWLLNITLAGLTIYFVFYHFEHLLCVFWPPTLMGRLIDIPWLW